MKISGKNGSDVEDLQSCGMGYTILYTNVGGYAEAVSVGSVGGDSSSDDWT